jgi:hypothetical protein
LRLSTKCIYITSRALHPWESFWGESCVRKGAEITSSRALRQRYYPWVVIGVAFLTVIVAFGARNAFAVFLVAVIDEFRWSRGLASGALMLGSVLWTRRRR